jgi:serralysin
MKSMLSRARFNTLSVLIAASAFLGATAPVQAAFHLWTITEVYSDASGSLQFIELVDNFGSQNFVGGQTFQLSNAGNTITHSYNFTTSLPSDGPGTHLLLGTAGIQAAGGPAPDFIIPNNFIFTAGGNISFFNASGTFPALPTDGNLSYTWGGGTAANTPENFGGQIGHVTVPEPATAFLFLAGASALALLRRRK